MSWGRAFHSQAAQDCPGLSLCRWLEYFHGDSERASANWRMYWRPEVLRKRQEEWGV